VLLDNAILAHHVWKNKLKAAISSQSQVDATSFARDDCCEIGQWLHGEGAVLYGSKPEFLALLHKHAIFHLEAGKVATEINARSYTHASRMIGSGTPFGSSSLAVAQAVADLKRIA
jgi:hypothetical protein